MHKLLRDVETRWISHEGPARRVLEQLPALLKHVKAYRSESPACVKGIEMYARMTDLERILSLAALLPMLAELKVLINVMQSRDAYVHDLSLSIQTVLTRLEAMYVKDATAYVGADFKSLSALSNCVSRKEKRRSASPIEFWSDADDPEDEGTAHYVYGDEGVELLAVPRRKGTAGPTQHRTTCDEEVVQVDVV
jgi:hypothetical protein